MSWTSIFFCCCFTFTRGPKTKNKIALSGKTKKKGFDAVRSLTRIHGKNSEQVAVTQLPVQRPLQRQLPRGPVDAERSVPQVFQPVVDRTARELVRVVRRQRQEHHRRRRVLDDVQFVRRVEEGGRIVVDVRHRDGDRGGVEAELGAGAGTVFGLEGEEVAGAALIVEGATDPEHSGVLSDGEVVVGVARDDGVAHLGQEPFPLSHENPTRRAANINFVAVVRKR